MLGGLFIHLNGPDMHKLLGWIPVAVMLYAGLQAGCLPVSAEGQPTPVQWSWVAGEAAARLRAGASPAHLRPAVAPAAPAPLLRTADRNALGYVEAGQLHPGRELLRSRQPSPPAPVPMLPAALSLGFFFQTSFFPCPAFPRALLLLTRYAENKLGALSSSPRQFSCVPRLSLIMCFTQFLHPHGPNPPGDGAKCRTPLPARPGS